MEFAQTFTGEGRLNGPNDDGYRLRLKPKGHFVGREFESLLVHKFQIVYSERLFETGMKSGKLLITALQMGL